MMSSHADVTGGDRRLTKGFETADLKEATALSHELSLSVR